MKQEQGPQYEDKEFLVNAAQRVYSVYGTEIIAGEPKDVSDRRARVNAWQAVINLYKKEHVNLAENITGLWLVLLTVRKQQDEKNSRLADLVQEQFKDVTHPHTQLLLRTVIAYQVRQIDDPLGQEVAVTSEVEKTKKDLAKMSKSNWSELRSMPPVVPIYALITGNMHLKPLTTSEDREAFGDVSEDE